MKNSALDLIQMAFGEKQIQPTRSSQATQLARLIAQVTPHNMVLRAVDGAPTLGEELGHLLRTLEYYLDLAAPGEITKREWAQVLAEGKASEAFETMREEAEGIAHKVQLAREVNLKWAARPIKVEELLYHVADHTIHHRGRLALLLRLCGHEVAEAEFKTCA